MAIRTITGHRWRIHGNELIMQHQGHCLLQTLPEQLGLGQSRIYQLNKGFNFIDTQFNPSKNLAIVSQIDQVEPILVLTLAMQGSSRFVSQNHQTLNFVQGYATITRFHSSVGERQYIAGQLLKHYRFTMTKSWLIKYFGEQKTSQLFQASNLEVLSHHPITPQSIFCIQHLLSTHTDSDLQLLYKYGLGISIVTAELTHWFDGMFENKCRFSQHDQAMANQARDVLYAEFKHPPTLEALAKRVGTNQCKLKQLFRHFFDSTPYNLLLQFRMQEARQFLASGQYQVAEVADLVGYQQASNFSAAFTKYFGVCPKRVAKQHYLSERSLAQ